MTDRLKDIFPTLEWSPPNTEGGLLAANDNIRGLIRAAIYGRHSAVLQLGTNGASSIQQIDLGRMHAETIPAVPLYEEVDENISGRSLANRPGLQRLLELARRKAFDVIIFSDLSRFGRHAGSCIEAIEELYNLGISVHVIGIGPVTKHVAMSMLVAAEVGLAYLHTSTRMALRARAKRGLVVSTAPYCYRKDPNRRGAIVRVEEEIERVEWMIEQVLARGTASGLECELNAMKWSRRDGQTWTRQNLVGTVRRPGILRQPAMAGILIYGKTAISCDPKTGKRIVTDTDPSTWTVADLPTDLGFISYEKFIRLQGVLDGNRRRPAVKVRPGPRTFLSAVVRCHKCGNNMSSVGTSGGKTYVVCSRFKRNAGCGEDVRIDRTAIEKLVLARVVQIMEDPSLQALAETQYVERRRKRIRFHEMTLKQAEKKLAEIQREVESIKDAARNDRILPEWGQEEMRELATRRMKTQIAVDDAKATLRRIAVEAGPIERIRAGVGDVGSLLASKRLSAPARAVLAGAVSRVVATPIGDRLVVRIDGLLAMSADIPRPSPGRPRADRAA